MIPTPWTGFLMLLAWMSFCAWAVVVCREKGVRPVRGFAAFVKKQPRVGRVLLGAFFLALWVFANTKPDGDPSANGSASPDSVSSEETGVDTAQTETMSASDTTLLGERSGSALAAAETGVGDVLLSAGETSPTPAATDMRRVITAADVERGFVMARVGTGETFDFSPPTSATVADRWRVHGAAEDWIYLAFEGWAFRVGTNEVDSLRVFSFGKTDPLVRDADGHIATNSWFAPFRAPLGVVPMANWGALDASTFSSQFWHLVTPSNTLQLTWQNVLLNRRADSPISFQMEVWPNGRFTYRYDLSRLNVDAVTNILVGASLGGSAWTTNSLPTNVTSMAFHPLTEDDLANPDRDGDGLPISDELFVYGTDPGLADTDFDGLSDGEEAALGTDPLNPRSVSGAFSDGIAVKLGDADPLSFPEGSTNTVLEHVFYSGATNGAFALPKSSVGAAVLRVSASGSGAGDLIVGGKVVPLAPPRGPALLVEVAKGETLPLRLRGDPTVEVSLDSEDFAFGVLPTLDAPGRVNFPNTAATTPCIHDFNARRKTVQLPADPDAEALTCAWRGDGGVEVENRPPRAVAITGNFSARETRAVTYTLSHPLHLFGGATFSQTVRFCPRPPEPDADGDDPPWCSGASSEDTSERWCCHWGACDGWCGCGCECAGVEASEEGEDFDLECPAHATPYADCARLHEDDYTNAVKGVRHLGGVLRIRDPPLYERIHLDVPTEIRDCCPCPDHGMSHAGVAYLSRRLKLVDTDGNAFARTNASCDARLAGVSPSDAVGDATLVIAGNGEILQRHDKTVLGVAIKGRGRDLAACNRLNRSFGLPMTVCTNVWDAPLLALVTNVRLPGGNVHLELADATAPFAIWYLDRRTGAFRKLLDSEAMPAKDLSIDHWKALMRRATDGTTPEMPIYVTSPAPGSVSLKFRYWAVVDGMFVEDEAAQRVTSLRPPLRLDVSRDGAIDDGDAAAWLDGHPFHYWTNEDAVRGDRAGTSDGSASNAGDLVVNGTLDLVNLFPVALDLKPFMDAWGDGASYVLKPAGMVGGTLNFCLADVPWRDAGRIQTTNVTTLAGEPLSSAQLTRLPEAGLRLRVRDVDRFSEGSGLMVCEATEPGASLRVEITAGDALLYSHTASMSILPVRQMYGWLNARDLSGGSVDRGTSLRAPVDGGNGKFFLFLHGANVSEADAGRWGDALFKRLWLSGSRAGFVNVCWRGDIGGTANYHENASNAFAVAARLAPVLADVPGEKVLMAHSLGNLVASSMIQDHGLGVLRFLMCNSSVPAEAYDAEALLRVPQLVHPDWVDYPTNSWAASWHALFGGDPDDDRRLLGWPGRFADVADIAVNFYSAGRNGGDEVLELAADNDVGVFTGVTDSLGHHAWHKQELFKGRGFGVGAGATDWSGWNIEENWLGVNKISVAEALRMGNEDFKTNTVFYCYPASMNSPRIPLPVRGAHLALGIPALTPAAGATTFGGDTMTDEMVNLNEDSDSGVSRPNGWPSRSSYSGRWLHSDMKDVSYFFNFKFYEKVIEKGGLR